MVHIIKYHYVRDLKNSRYPEIKGLDTALLCEQLDFFERHFQFITCEQLLEAISGNIDDLPENSVLLTFDDGYQDHFSNVFPILLQRRIQGFFSMPGKILKEHKLLDVNRIHFILATTKIEQLMKMIFERLDYYRNQGEIIASNNELYQKLAHPSRFDPGEIIFVKRLLQAELEENVRNRIASDLFERCVGVPEDVFVQELYLSRDQIKAMRQCGMIFGLHGYEHSWMNRLSLDELSVDLQKAKEAMQFAVDPNHWICCYPYGGVNDAVVELVRSQGAVAGFCTQVGIADLKRDHRYLLPRMDTNDYPPVSFFYKQI